MGGGEALYRLGGAGSSSFPGKNKEHAKGMAVNVATPVSSRCAGKRANSGRHKTLDRDEPPPSGHT